MPPKTSQKIFAAGPVRCLTLCALVGTSALRLSPATGLFLLDLPSDPVPDHVSCNERLNANQTKSLADFDGPGCISHIWIVAGRPDGSMKMTSRKMVLRINFDDSKEPNVESPLGDFFGIMHGLDYYDINTPFISVMAANGYNCYFQMPFAKNAHIELVNGPENVSFFIQVDWERYPGQEMKEQRRFCAQWRRENPAQRYGDDYMLLDADGPGDLIGFFLGVRLYDNTDRWSHGGAENMYIDGMADHPAYIRGIGGEDAFGTSGGGVLHTPDTHLYSGMPYYYTADVGEARGAQRVVGYRFYPIDRIHFKESIRFQFGSMANDLCSIAYWYQRGAPRRFTNLPDWPLMLPGAELPKGAVDRPLPDNGSWGLGVLLDNAKGEAVELALAATAGNQDIKSGSWIEKDSYHGFIDFDRVHRPKTRGPGTFYSGKAAEAVSTIEAPADMTVRVRIAWDDRLVLRVNGSAPIDFGANAYFRDRTVEVPFKKGPNRVSVVESNEAGTNHGGWVFAFRATAPDGSILIPHFSK